MVVGENWCVLLRIVWFGKLLIAVDAGRRVSQSRESGRRTLPPPAIRHVEKENSGALLPIVNDTE